MSLIRADHIEFSFWLVFGNDGSMRMTRREPSIARTERAMAMTARLPLSLWRTPSLRGRLTVTNDDAPASIEVDVEAAADALKAALGVDIDLSVQEGGQ